MATFSYFQHYPHSLLDPLLYSTPNPSIDLSGFIDLHQDQDPLHSLPNTSTIEDTSLNPFDIDNNPESFALMNQSNRTTGSSSDDQLSQGPSTPSTGNKRRKKARNVANSMEGVEGRKSKKQRNGSPSDVKEKRGSDEKHQKDYIHVRARRGQATDSHSLAERVRREKISERMKILQNLVPNCDKVTGKALMLDEIINYVQSLQNQVEYLSMKLASISPVVYDFGSDLDDLILRPEMESPEVGMSFTNTMPPTTPLYPSQIQEEGEERTKFADKTGFNNNFCSFT